MSKTANRGKSAEAAVMAYLKAYDEKHQDFDFARNYDAHSAGGRFQRQTGDFQFYMGKGHGVIEVKEVAHDFRLPHKNMGTDSVGKLWKRQLAGGLVIVLVNHTTTGLWRVPLFETFRKREGGSWDLSAWPTFGSCKLALDYLGAFV
jgi:hypothetical protein